MKSSPYLWSLPKVTEFELAATKEDGADVVEAAWVPFACALIDPALPV